MGHARPGQSEVREGFALVGIGLKLGVRVRALPAAAAAAAAAATTTPATARAAPPAAAAAAATAATADEGMTLKEARCLEHVLGLHVVVQLRLRRVAFLCHEWQRKRARERKR